MPTAVLRRYTPPTCTLEVTASGSALSRWAERPVLKNLRFQLSFDDPKLMPDQQVMVSGDQSQLEALHTAVSDYVQQLVGRPASAVQWEPSLWPAQTSGQTGVQTDAQTDAQTDTQTAQLADGPQQLPPLEPEVSIEPHGLLSHELRLGSLANSESGPAIRLSVLQLFDLANALEDYHTESFSLPVAEQTWLTQLPRRWPAAAAAILALGATGAMAKFVLDISRPVALTASAPNERQVNAELNRELFPHLVTALGTVSRTPAPAAAWSDA